MRKNMKKEQSIKEILERIWKDKAFEGLNDFQDSHSWKSLTEEEKELLAFLFIEKGSGQLGSQDFSFVDSFEIASAIAPDHFEVFYRQGKVCATQIQYIQCLLLASQAFSRAIACQPDSFAAWLSWGDVLLHIGAFYQKPSYFNEADDKFKIAEAIAKDNPSLLHGVGFLFWRWGLCWSLLARHSGEPQDLRHAIDKYKQACFLFCDESDFWHDYGSALLELGMLVQRTEILIEASEYYQKALSKTPDQFTYWMSLALCYQHLLEATFEEKYFQLSYDSFEKAASLETGDPRMWLKWGQLLSQTGKSFRNLEMVEASLEKFEKADVCDPDNPIIMSRWGEAELLVGTNTDRIDLIRSAEGKIVKSLEILPDNADIWFVYGACLNALGHYFHDESYYNQAIEKFQYGLSLDGRHPILWYGLAMAHYALGDYREDFLLLEKSLRDFAKVVESGGGGFPQFWNDWGVTHMKMAEMTNSKGHVEAAIEKFESAVKQPGLDGDQGNADLEWIYNYGCAYDFLGDFSADEECYERAIYLLSNVVHADPEYDHARYNLALALVHLADVTTDVHLYEKAIEHFLVLIGKDNEDEMASHDLGIAYIDLAVLMQDQHHPEKNHHFLQQAEHRLMQSAALGNTQAYYSLGCLYSLRGNYDGAMHYIERAQQQGALPPLEEMMHDEWLDPLRQAPAFRQFIASLASRQSQEESK
jgi:tetratricopeptide (TPR) repeat protein